MKNKNEKTNQTKFQEVLSLVDQKMVLALVTKFELARSSVEQRMRNMAIS
jgi:hypothetical protein